MSAYRKERMLVIPFLCLLLLGFSTACGDLCAESEWTCNSVGESGPYGTKTMTVQAKQNWVNTGLYLSAGETATIEVTGGAWTMPRTGDPIDHGSCLIGDLVARVGLHYKDPQLTCVDGTTTLVADKDGIVFVGALTENDLGETYESRLAADGEKTIVVTSSGRTVPTVQAADAAAYPFHEVESGWVEVWGAHVILTLPTSIAAQDAATLKRAADRLDAIYDLHEELRGDVPHSGQRLRFFPDGTQPGYMLAGNPIRMNLDLVYGGSTQRISRAGEGGTDVWGFAHEMGHDFSFVGAFWGYQQDTLEAWPNVFTMHALQSLGLPTHPEIAYCNESSTGAYVFGAGEWGPWTGLCFLMQPQYRYGWDFYKQFFRSINVDHEMPWKGDWETTAFHFVHDKFEQASGEDVTPLFSAWGVPHP